MTGYSIEVQMVRWKCNCRKHVNGVCANPRTNSTKTLREAYFGSFGFGIKTLGDALRKWDNWMSQLGEIEENRQ